MVAERRDGYGEALNPAWDWRGMIILRRVEGLLSGMVGMILDRDIWRAANLLISEYGDGAEFVAARRADEMLDRGDHEGETVWLRIRQAIVEMQATPMGKPN
jgi:hypothetical protein